MTDVLAPAPPVAADAAALLHDLEPAMSGLLERHLAQATPWYPHELVPWSLGRDFDAGYSWSAEDSAEEEAVRSSLFVNLLTEDNLPYYFRTIEATFGADSVWGEWVRRWTAEEGRHAIVLRDYLTITRAIDPVELEDARMAQVSGGETPQAGSPRDCMAYVAMQELATRIAHFNTGKTMSDPVGYEVMKRVAADENHHFIFYRDLVAEALVIDPSGMVEAIERQVAGFTMPGSGIIGFSAHARAIAKAGIYNLQIHHDKILVPLVVHHWKIPELTDLTPEGERARDALLKRIERIGRIAEREAARRARSTV